MELFLQILLGIYLAIGLGLAIATDIYGIRQDGCSFSTVLVALGLLLVMPFLWLPIVFWMWLDGRK